MRVKIFSIKNLKNEQELEDKINSWLSNNSNIEVVKVEQSACGGSFNPSLWLISVWYKTNDSE